MTKKKNPCLNCEDRKLGCHSDCNSYLEWIEEYHNEKDKIRKSKQAYYLSIGHAINVIYRNEKKSHKK